MTLDEYWDLCGKHDWTYQYSDDHSKWSKGSSENDQLMRYLHESNNPEFEIFNKVYNAWREWVFHNGIMPTIRDFK